MSIAAVLEVPHDEPPQLWSVDGPAPTVVARAAESGAASLRTIMIVEDEPALRDSLREIFRRRGYETVEAENGEIALQILRGRHIDVLILDLHLPKLDGVGVLQQIDPPPPIVIIHSAFEFYKPSEVRKSTGSKVFRMFQKPIPPAELLSAVSAAVAELDALGE